MSFKISPLFFAGATAGGALIAHGLFGGYPDKIAPGGKLSKKEQAVIRACADSFFPPGGPIPVSGTDAKLVDYMEGYVARTPDGQRVLVHLLFWFIEHGTWLFGPKPVRFTSLSEAERLAVLEDMRTSPIYFRRIAFLSMRTMLTMGYLANPDVARAMRMKADTDPFRKSGAASAQTGEVAS